MNRSLNQFESKVASAIIWIAYAAFAITTLVVLYILATNPWQLKAFGQKKLNPTIIASLTFEVGAMALFLMAFGISCLNQIKNVALRQCEPPTEKEAEKEEALSW